MTREEILALLPKDQPAELDSVFYRDLANHVNMFGPACICHKRGRGWAVEFRGHGFPVIFKTKREAIEKAQSWVTATHDLRN